MLPPNLKYPRTYWNLRSFLREAQWWDTEKIAEWQLDRFREIVEYANKYVPGYQELFKSAGVKPGDINSLQDIRILPFVTKEIIRDNLSDFTSREFDKSGLRYMTTGGSTGIPFGFWNTWNNYFIENAFIHSGWERTGWKWGDRSAVLRGAFVGNSIKFWDYDRFLNELQLSSYYLTEESYHKYIEIIRRHNPHYLQAYPSSINLLADMIIKNGDEGRLSFRALFLGSENLYDWQREKISRAFPGSIQFSWYGHAEKAVLAMECEHSKHYHAWPFYGITEIIGADGNEVAVGSSGEIIGTSFWNYATPFIRYRTMDNALKGKSGCEMCGRNFLQLEKIEGRLQEFIVTSTGRHISMTSINMHDDIFDALKQFQFYQDSRDELIFRYIPRGEVSKEILEEIQNRLKVKLGEDIQLKLVPVNDIPRKKSGKFSFLEQKLSINYGDV